MPGPLRLRVTDHVGLGLLAAWLYWVGASASLNGRVVPPTATFLVAPLLVVAGVVAGRFAAQAEARAIAPSEVVDVALLCLVTALLPGIRLRLAPGPVPLGYANANTAAAVQVLALCGLALLNPRRAAWRRAVLGVGAVTAGLAAVHHGSQAGLIVGLPVAGAVALMALRPARRAGWAIGLGAASVVAAGAALLALAAQPSWPAALLRALDPVRKRMWAEALALWRAHPWTGGGPGSYAEVNPYAGDTDTIAAHSSLLQAGSELGLVGVLLLALLVAAGFVSSSRGRPPYAVLAAAAWTALWVQSLVDHLFDYPALGVLAGAVLGWAGGCDQPSPDSPDHFRSR